MLRKLKRKLLKHELVYQSLEENGFCIIPLLNLEELELLNNKCNSIFFGRKGDFISSSHFLDIELSKEINELLIEILAEKFYAIFPNLQLLGGTFATKNKGKEVLKVHNDWTIVEETNSASFNLWIPLIDVNKKNGTLGMVPGSHKWEHGYRGYGIKNCFEEWNDKLIDLGFEPSVKAGEGILYNHRLLHYSRPNTTNISRNTIIIGVKDKKSPLQITIKEKGNIVQTYQILQEDFYLFNPEHIKRERKLLRTEPFVECQHDWKSIKLAYYENLPQSFHQLAKKSTGFFAKLLEKLSF